MTKPLRNHKSPHFLAESIPVEFLVIHYTAQSLKSTLDIFLSKEGQVSSHLIIGKNGELYELVKCWDGVCYKAFHAGKSRWREDKKLWENFNSFSLGIELVNPNGNLFPYAEPQKQTLFKALKHLQTMYPTLKNPHRILGHEHIAGFRGKADPGYFFDWNEFFKENFSTQKPPQRNSLYSKTKQQTLSRILKNPTHLEDRIAKKISIILENSFPFWIKKWQLKLVMPPKKGQVIVEYVLLLAIAATLAMVLINFTDTSDSAFGRSWKKMLTIIADDLST